mgnify:CR=1 FL=1
MAQKVSQTIEKVEIEGLKNQEVRYLRKHPESVNHLTFGEVREQIVMHPDAQPRELSLR